MWTKKYGLLAITSCSILMLWAGALLAQKGRPFQEVFPNAKVDWQVELPHPKGRIVGCDDGFVFISEDRMHLYRFGAEGRKLWELRDIKRFPYGEGRWYGGIRGALVSQDGQFVYVLRDAGLATKPWKEYTHEQLLGLSKPYGEYLDVEGNKLWERDEPPLLSKISPQGKYLMTEFDPMSERQELVVVSGKDGSILWRREGEIGIWDAEFATDERIVYYRHPTLYLLDSATGSMIWQIDMHPYFSRSGFESIAHPQITVSKDGNRIVLFGYYALRKSAIISLDSQGNILWIRADLPRILVAQVSRSGKTVFIPGYESSRLIDNDTGTDLWTQRTYFSWIEKDLMQVTESIIVAPGYIKPDKMSGTVFFQLGKGGKFQSLHKIQEVAIPISSPAGVLGEIILVRRRPGKVDFLHITFKDQEGGQAR